MHLHPQALKFAAFIALAVGLQAAIDRQNFDLSVRPQDDFYQYANGSYLKNTPIPPDAVRWGHGTEMREQTDRTLRAICERAAAKSAAGTALERQVGDFFASGMDEKAINAAGITALKPELDLITGAKTPSDVLVALARVGHYRANAAGRPYDYGLGLTLRVAGINRLSLGVGGLGLTRPDAYLREDDVSKKLRAHYIEHVGRMLILLGDAPETAHASATAVMKLETALANASSTGGGNSWTVPDLQKLTPEIDWPAFFTAAGVSGVSTVVIRTDAAKTFALLLAQTPLADWQAYLRWHLAAAAAPFLDETFVRADFEFNWRLQRGQEIPPDRWRRVVEAVDDHLGDALGQLYVADYFSPEIKIRTLAMVDNIRAALRERLQSLDWIDDATRARALVKLDAMGVKIGYPDTWSDDRSLEIDRGSYVLNVFRAREHVARNSYARIGQPSVRSVWDIVKATRGSAMYRVDLNTFVIPACGLQGHLATEADDAVNYGTVGYVIGHEMTHAFDGSGRFYGATGNREDWWSPASAARFRERAAAIVKQFNGYFPFPDLHVNGERTQNENIADLGGVRIAYSALMKALANRPRPKIGGFTPEQRFFLAYATAGAGNIRPEALRRYIKENTHAPQNYRVNWPLANLPEFYAAFDVPDGAPMWRPANERVTIW
ncbi:MAG: M13 family metallopeptidase [Opitutaceae bacterium]|nr:M13 family metallopeptidase [Opitutaceae bacterium]